MNTLKQNLENSVNAIIKAFEIKQDLYFDFFVADDVTGVACFSNEYYLHISDVCHDLFTGQPKGQITNWLEESIDNGDETINYQSYCLGKRFENSEFEKDLQFLVDSDVNILEAELNITSNQKPCISIVIGNDKEQFEICLIENEIDKMLKVVK
ncbi:hypothetical protein M1M24_gp06 [Polaribacter phage Freya_1]|uniref:Uncharacterized protein n=1 Tax=Polaribacter phage Freya_1 TaxID=2745662 RepID=A0A8E4ZD55_9CAUD|nr:hypothetical protein M1M24_gp06 [Polaribacter phage Freya_1]QQV90943.1 hypothetical protein Freya2_6 [Polaribacter phage Freya_2]QQV91011.1 hypothetical protein Freya3_6 [Polaribacter phage Freya_3]QQV91079.1 hypothetical protein Freya4_6 [Polaribacter phage Freya_4]QQV91154.1 hypothetical protein Freya8_13 [Polaribacter phage Freya_8]QQV91231.1 hypothetical protein Freya9_15 [Polaribacter phage Freya_9]QQV91309.1 hypothetical protein Freya10_16 [Polaribacter phage Freya_10]QYV99888.1 hyp